MKKALTLSLYRLSLTGLFTLCSLVFTGSLHADDFPTPEELAEEIDVVDEPRDVPPPEDMGEPLDPVEAGPPDDGDYPPPPPDDIPPPRGFGRRGGPSYTRGGGTTPSGGSGFSGNPGEVHFQLVDPDSENQPKTAREKAYESYKVYRPNK